MKSLNEPFEIEVKSTAAGLTRLKVSHPTETFDLQLNGQHIALINNGDNSWSIVTGRISQEDANLIGAEIEKYYKSLQP